jgi:hypothetical protein
MRFTEPRRPSFPLFLSTCLPAILLAGALAGCSGGGGGGSSPDAAPPDAVPPPSLDEINTLFARECGGGICHIDAFSLGGDLDLTPAVLCAELVGVQSEQVPGQILLVRGNADASYLVCKSDPNCPDVADGTDLMPLPDGLNAADLKLMSDWVAGGAPGCP